MSSGLRKGEDPIDGIDQNIQAIPGGRYGCAQFIKICGPPILSKLSLGRLAQMIQQAVQDDLLRYHKTLLVWTNKIITEQDLYDTNQANKEGDSKQDALIKEELA